jgi:hypothetical protein
MNPAHVSLNQNVFKDKPHREKSQSQHQTPCDKDADVKDKGYIAEVD